MADNGVSPNLGDGIDVHVVDVAAAAVGEGVQPVLARHSTAVGAADGLRAISTWLDMEGRKRMGQNGNKEEKDQ